LKWTQTLAGSGGADSNGLIDCGMAIKKEKKERGKKKKQMAAPSQEP